MIKLALLLTFVITTSQMFAQAPYDQAAKDRYLQQLKKTRRERVDFSRHIQSQEDKNVTLHIQGSRGRVTINIIKIQEVEDFSQDTVVELLDIELDEDMNFGELQTALATDDITSFDVHPDVNTIYLCQNEGHYSFDIIDHEFHNKVEKLGLRSSHPFR